MNASTAPTTPSAIQRSPSDPAKGLQPLRAWPVILLLIAMIVTRYLPAMIEDGPANIWMVAAMGPAACGILIVLWWLLASRASWPERLWGMLVLAGIVGLTLAVIHPSMAGPALMVLTLPVGLGVFGIGAVLCSQMRSSTRTVLMLLMTAIAFGFSGLLRAEGMWGNFAPGLAWRWNASAEELFLKDQETGDVATATVDASAMAVSLATPEWPGFRGPGQDSRQTGVQLVTDWAANPPAQLWKIKVGPAWSSFAVAGDFLFTLEQRGAQEAIVCYDANSGNLVWKQSIEGRFDDPLGGPGPRATPTLAESDVFAVSGMGWLCRLDGETGDILWKADLREVADRDPPMWGFSCSPLVTDGVVVVHAGGDGDRGVLAFDISNGELKWSSPAGKDSYSSPQKAEFAGQSVILMLTNSGINAVDPITGESMLDYDWAHEGPRILQPQVLEGNHILLPTGMGSGTRKIEVSIADGSWSAKEVWTSRHMKPDYNDFVVHDGQLYGFDNTVFACVDLATGKRQWKGGRYGKGQVLLLDDVGLLLVITETGEVVLLEATPEEHRELAKFKAIEGKTWNHPVVIGNRLYVRNAQEAACFVLPVLE